MQKVDTNETCLIKIPSNNVDTQGLESFCIENNMTLSDMIIVD